MVRRGAWVALASVMMVGFGPAAMGQSPTTEQSQAPRTVHFDILPQDLDTAMTRLADQAGIRLLGASGDLAGKRTAGLSGNYTIAQALNALLTGSGVSWRFSEANTVVLERPAPGSGASGAVQLDPVRVQAGVPAQAMIDNLPPPYAGGQVAKGAQVGFLGERDFMDTPFNQSAYTSTLIQNQQARSIADVAANDPSVRNAWPAVGYSTALMIRGFSFNSNDMSFGGLYGIAPTLLVAPDYLERVEILKGPSAMVNGMPPFGSVGGAVNLVPKRAQGELNRATASFATAGQVGGTTDISRRFGDGDAWGVRFNGIYRNGSTQVDRQTQAVGAAVFGLDYRGDRFRAAVDYGYQTQTTNSPLRATYVNAGLPVPLAPGGSANWFQPWTFQQNTDLFGTARVEYDVTPDWTAYAAFGGRRSLFNALTGFATVTSANGNLTENPLNFPGWSQANTEEVGVRGRADTGPVHHALSLNATRVMLEGGQLFPVVATISSNLYQPTFIAKPNVAALNPPKTNSIELSTFGIADIISVFDERIQFIVGGRLQRVQVGNYSPTTGVATSYYDQSAFSPAVGFIAKPLSNLSVYGNFIQGLQQGPTAPVGTLNSGTVFAPQKTQQLEIGAKLDLGDFATTLSLFQIDRPFGVTNPSTLIFGVGGTQRNQGLEWMMFGEPFQGFRPLGGVTLLNARQLDTGSTLTNGLKATGVPDVQLNLGAEWDASFLRGLTFSGRLIYTSLQYLDAANTQSIPSWTRFDAGVRYVFERKDGKPIALRFNVENLFNLNYWASANSELGLAMGAPRTFLLSLSAHF
ncbi:MAG: TonB-dependent receptor [Reyranella sp.]|nr:TonB-dependent receptor [Reyranella sp.]